LAVIYIIRGATLAPLIVILNKGIYSKVAGIGAVLCAEPELALNIAIIVSSHALL